MLFTGNKFHCFYLGRHNIDVTRTVGSSFAPSWDLLKAYKAGTIDWAGYEVRYRKEMRALYATAPRKFEELVDYCVDHDVILVCYEDTPKDGTSEDDIKCHRRLLADMLRKCAAKRGLTI